MMPSQLIQLRAVLGWSQNRLAKQLGVNRSTIHRWELGTRRIPAMAEKLLAIIASNSPDLHV